MSKNNGIMLTAEQMAALTYARSASAYRRAYRYAAQGMDPEWAAFHGNAVAEWVSAWWFYVLDILAVVVVALSFGGDKAIIGWGTAVMAWTAVVLRWRLNRFASTAPWLRRRYWIPTWLFVLIGVLVGVGTFVGSVFVGNWPQY